MIFLNTSDIRSKFIEFFKSRHHVFVPSASTVPVDDKTILFTIAGMTQFKACLTGQEKRSYKRATNSQKCIRVADLDDVGKDGRHLTMFEMLGSWSFGDYYKKEAIAWAYEFVKNELALDFSRIWISVHHTDQESALYWETIGIPKNRIVSLGDKDNFWAMGPTGPCGPCSEMYYDQGESVGACYKAGIQCKGPGCDCDRFLEFWNLVFMQFQRDENGKLHDLPMKSVDTGMGLERVAALLQGKTNIFETDLFLLIRKRILALARSKNKTLASTLEALTDEYVECTNVIADHARFLSFTIADGAGFSNEGRGYVLRRVLRRAVRYIDKLCPDWDTHESVHQVTSHENNHKFSFLVQIVFEVIHVMEDFFPELSKNKKRIEELILREEAQFRKTLKSGLNKFHEFLDLTRAQNAHVFSGEHVFVLHDTFGFPADVTRILCEENKISMDLAGYESYMLAQKEKSRAEAKFYKFLDDPSPWTLLNSENQNKDANFDGYFLITNLYKDETNFFQKILSYDDVTKIRQLQNDTFELVIKNTPFYPEGGGQVSDKGFIEIVNGEDVLKFDVCDVKRTPAYIAHILHYEEWNDDFNKKRFSSDDFKKLIHSGTQLTCYVDLSFRQNVARHHTATHLLHKALQIVLGDHVRQAGSLVKNDMLRFDFSYGSSVSKQDLEKIENIVNSEILKNLAVQTHQNMQLDEAKNMGALAMFNEKYADTVRVLQIEKFSLELCGGTHVQHTGDIGQFKILSEGSVTSGVRRIEAVTGLFALDYVRNVEKTIETTIDTLKCSKSDLLIKISQMKDLIKNQEKEIFDFQNRIADYKVQEILAISEMNDELSDGLNKKLNSHDIKCIATFVPRGSLHELELLCDKIKAKFNHIVVLATVIENKVHVIAGMHQNLIKTHPNLHLGKFMRAFCEQLNGKGGGKPDFARGSGVAIEKVNTLFSQKNLVDFF